MPFTSEWIPPEIFLTHKDVIVYHSYKDNEFSNGRSNYWFTMSEQDEVAHEFDVRDLPTWKPLLKKLEKTVKRPKFLTADNFPVLNTVSVGADITNTKSDPRFKKYWQEDAKWKKYHQVVACAELAMIKKAIRQAIEQKILKQA